MNPVRYNSRIVDSTNVTCKIGSFDLYLQSINHSASISRNVVRRGLGYVGIRGYTIGTLTVDGTMTMLHADASNFEAYLESIRRSNLQPNEQAGIWNVVFQLELIVRAPDFIENCLLKNVRIDPGTWGADSPEGSDAMTREYKLLFENRRINGIWDVNEKQ